MALSLTISLLPCPLMPLPLQQKKRTTIKKSFSPAVKPRSFEVFSFSDGHPNPGSIGLVRKTLSSKICSLPRRDKTLLEAKVAHAQTCFINFFFKSTVEEVLMKKLLSMSHYLHTLMTHEYETLMVCVPFVI